MAQHRALLPLPDPEGKQALACQALDEGWSAEALSWEVRKRLPKSTRGRKPLPALVKRIRGVARTLDASFEDEVTPDAVTMLEPEERSALAAQVEESLARLESLRNALAEARKAQMTPTELGLARPVSSTPTP